MGGFFSSQAVRVDTKENVQAWIQLVDDAMLAAGCVRTDDTGQLNKESITQGYTTGSPASLGFLMYEINDSLSSSHPVYIKILFNFATMSSGTNIPAPINPCYIGFGTNGAGGLNGGGFYVGGSHNSFTEASWYAFTPFSTATTFSTKMNGFFAAGIGLCNGRRRAQDYYPVTPSSLFIVLRRTKNESGMFDGKGVVVVTPTPTTTENNKVSELRHIWCMKEGVSTTYINYSGSLPKVLSIDGILVAKPIDVTGGSYLDVMDEVVCLRQDVSINMGQVIHLSTDGVSEKPYIIIQTKNNINGDRYQFNSGTYFSADTKEPTSGMLGVRFDG